MKTFSLKIILLVAALWPLAVHAEKTIPGKNILIFGDSLSAGYGIAVEKSWASLLQQELRLANSGFNVVNASISGETASGGQRRIIQALQQHRPAIVIVALGANDGLRGAPIKNTEANLNYIIEKAKSAGAKVLLIGMKLPPNYGATYITQFQNIFPRLAKKHRTALLPFLLEGVAAEQFLPDNLHPAAAAQAHIMRTVLRELKPLLN